MNSTQLSGSVQVVAQGLYDQSTTALHALGELVHSNDGRAFRYCKAGELLVSGSLYQAKVENTSDQNLAVAAAAIGDTTITTTSTVTVDANEYAGGLVVVSVTPGIGKVYKIRSHPAASAAALTITLEDSVKVALTTSSKIDLVANPFSNVLINPTTATSAAVGVAVAAIASASFGWLGVAGAQPVLADAGAAVTVGTEISASNQTAGAVEGGVAAQGSLGIALSGIASNEVGLAMLHLL